jgi:hypothetical protein
MAKREYEMDVSSGRPATTEGEVSELGYGRWIAFWGQLIVLAVLAVLGAFYASADEAPGDYACGLTLGLAATALAFLRLKNRFDGAGVGWGGSCLVDDVANLVAVIVVFTIVALAGLLVAAGFEYGGLHDAGVALFATSAVAVFLSIKHVFDNLDRTR